MVLPQKERIAQMQEQLTIDQIVVPWILERNHGLLQHWKLRGIFRGLSAELAELATYMQTDLERMELSVCTNHTA
jgi:hypothetical protein